MHTLALLLDSLVGWLFGSYTDYGTVIIICLSMVGFASVVCAIVFFISELGEK
jgi:hypothetical protein